MINMISLKKNNVYQNFEGEIIRGYKKNSCEIHSCLFDVQILKITVEKCFYLKVI